MRKAFTGTLLLLFFTVFFQVSAGARDGTVWSDTQPPLNLTHIFEGEINSRGKPTGFHHRPNVNPPKSARIQTPLSGVNQFGIYTAIVEIFDPEHKIWKSKFSSMFPANLSRAEITSLILTAFHNSPRSTAGKWRGQSGAGFYIEGYLLSNGRIVTAYPIYEANRQ